MAYKRPSPAPIIEGYTNATSMANTFGTAYFDGSKVNTVNPGTAMQILRSNGTGMAPTFQNSSGGSGISIVGFTAQNNVSAWYLSTNANDSYLAPFGLRNPGLDSSATNSNLCPLAGTFSNMYVFVATNASTSDVTFTLRINGVSTSLAVTVTALTTGLFSNTVNTATITTGDAVQMLCQQATTGNISGSISMQFS